MEPPLVKSVHVLVGPKQNYSDHGRHIKTPVIVSSNERPVVL